MGFTSNTLDEVAIDEPLADGLFLVVPGISRAAGDGPGVPDHGGAAIGLEGGEDVLRPAPVGGGFPGETGSGGEAVELVIALGELERLFPRPDPGGDAIQLIIEDIAEALGEDEREDEVLVFRRVLRTTDGAGGVPDPLFQRFVLLGLGGGGFADGHQVSGS